MTAYHDPGALQEAAFALQLLLAAVFLVSTIGKLRHPGRFVRVVADYDVLPRLAPLIAPVVIATEAFLAIAFLSGAALAPAIAVAAVAVACFALATGVNLRRGRIVACGCFGSSKERISSRSLGRLGLVAAALVALAAVLSTPEASPTTLGELRAAGAPGLPYVLEAASIAAAAGVAAAWALEAPTLARVARAALATGATR